jgi:hypothetical protein
MKKVERWKMEMPTEEEMLPKDKYTVFDRKVKRYRKGIHSKSKLVPQWTRDGYGDETRTIANIEQRCRSGRESARDSTRRVSERIRNQVNASSGCIYHVLLLYNQHSLGRVVWALGNVYLGERMSFSISACLLPHQLSHLSQGNGEASDCKNTKSSVNFTSQAADSPSFQLS